MSIRKVACNYNGMIITARIHTLKFLLRHIFGNIIGYPMVPTDLKHRMVVVYEAFNKRKQIVYSCS